MFCVRNLAASLLPSILFLSSPPAIALEGKADAALTASSDDFEFLKAAHEICDIFKKSEAEIRSEYLGELEERIRAEGPRPGLLYWQTAMNSILQLGRNGGFDEVVVESVLSNLAYGVLHEYSSWPLASGTTILEASSIIQYTGGDFQTLNPLLRSKVPPKSAIVYRDHMNRALEKLPSYQGIVKRGIWPFPDWEKVYFQDGIVEEKAFVSTTSDQNMKEFDAPIRFLIHSRNGKDISRLTQNPNEKEVLFKAGSRFRVISVERNSELRGVPNEIRITLLEVP